MKLHCIFGQIEFEVYELVDCWDEFKVENMFDDYHKHLANLKQDKKYTDIREIIVNVAYKYIEESFKVPVVDGDVKV